MSGSFLETFMTIALSIACVSLIAFFSFIVWLQRKRYED
jgi:hypothetical protein